MPVSLCARAFARQLPSGLRPLVRHNAHYTTSLSRPFSSSSTSRPCYRFTPTLRPTSLTSITSALTNLTICREFSATPRAAATYNQVRRGCRQAQRARRGRSPALTSRPEMKGVCLKTGVTKPKKPNSGERKTARVRLSSGRVVTAIIPGEGMYILNGLITMVIN
jgi:small subunit ribosomal protein S12